MFISVSRYYTLNAIQSEPVFGCVTICEADNYQIRIGFGLLHADEQRWSYSTFWYGQCYRITWMAPCLGLALVQLLVHRPFSVDFYRALHLSNIIDMPLSLSVQGTNISTHTNQAPTFTRSASSTTTEPSKIVRWLFLFRSTFAVETRK